MAATSGTQKPRRSAETEKPEKSREHKEVPESTTQDMAATSGTQGPRRSSETEKSEESRDHKEVPESTTQDMAATSGTQGPRRSAETEKSEESRVNTKILESPIQDIEGLSGTQRNEAPLNSITGTYVWEKDTVKSVRAWFCSLFYSQASPTCETEPERNPDNTKTDADGNTDDESTEDNFEMVDNSEDADDHDVIKGKSFKENMDKIRKIIESTYYTLLWPFSGYHKVGIFSRSSESDYDWLIKQLESELFRSTVSNVQPHYISNSGMQQFRVAVSQCSFGILYHTKNRGRINIVDVTDSLYDEELKYMSECLGKENVIVIVDDLVDTSNMEKNRILRNQPSIKSLAQDLILFNATEKYNL
ncbi:uncharacterized protein ACMZJ9_009906 [Mantella aurantiaca]